MTARCIMVQGTGSSVGKSRLVTGLCRVFKQDGFKVAPFKAQNMALNSYITKGGLEMGRAQVAQAEACGIEPQVIMNPVLLKPHTDKNSQVIVRGKPYGSLSAMDYHEYKVKLLNIVKECYDELARDNDIIVIEGAGSPAEINLRERDIVNMGMAELVDAPVVLVGDIDRGGVFAALAGTLLLLTDEEKARVKAVIINKFRGDLNLLQPGLKMIEDIINRPVLGVLPYTDIYIDEEDSPESEQQRLLQKYKPGTLQVKVLSLPRITNFTDFVPLGELSDINLSYVSREAIGDADMVIIPGSENPTESMEFIRRRGWDKEIEALAKKGTVILGIGSSCLLLGKTFSTFYNTNENQTIEGLKLIDVHVKLKQQEPKQVIGNVLSGFTPPADILSSAKIKGYRMYSGEITHGKVDKFIKIETDPDNVYDGLISKTGRVIGTFVNGIFENPDFTSRFVNFLKSINHAGNVNLTTETFDFKKFKENEYDRWANIVRQYLDIEKLYKIMGIKV